MIRYWLEHATKVGSLTQIVSSTGSILDKVPKDIKMANDHLTSILKREINSKYVERKALKSENENLEAYLSAMMECSFETDRAEYLREIAESRNNKSEYLT
eukprot:UN34497